MKKKIRKFGSGGMPPIGDSVASGNRVAKQEGAEMRKMGVGAKKRPGMPPIGESVKSGNRVGRQEGDEMRKMGVTKAKGGKVKAYAKGGKVKRYDDGGGVGEMGRAGLDLEAQARRGETLRELDRMDTSVPKVSAPAKKQSFSQAFAAARKRGDKTFQWNGGSYGTKLKGEDDKSTPTKSTPAASSPAKATSSKPADGGTDKEITVTAQRPNKGGDPVSRTAVGSAVNRGIGSINAQMQTQARNMAENRKKNPDLVSQMMSKLGYAKGGSVTRGDGIARKGHTKGKMR